MHWYKIELRFAASFFAIMVTVLSYELFTDSLKPVIMGYVKRYQFKKEINNNLNNENIEGNSEFNDEILKEDELKNDNTDEEVKDAE